jgi:iron(III) transport system substrate-binding protein
MPARTDIKADRPLINDLTLLEAKAADDATRKEILARFASIFAAK